MYEVGFPLIILPIKKVITIQEVRLRHGSGDSEI